MTNHNWLLSISQPGYMPDTAYELDNYTLREALAALWDEIEYTADTHELEPPAQLDATDSDGASCQFAGYVHVLERMTL